MGKGEAKKLVFCINKRIFYKTAGLYFQKQAKNKEKMLGNRYSFLSFGNFISKAWDRSLEAKGPSLIPKYVITSAQFSYDTSLYQSIIIS